MFLSTSNDSVFKQKIGVAQHQTLRIASLLRLIPAINETSKAVRIVVSCSFTRFVVHPPKTNEENRTRLLEGLRPVKRKTKITSRVRV